MSATLGPTDIVVDRRPDGTLLIRSPHELGPYPERMTDSLDLWARNAAYRTFLAQRDANGRWRNVTYAEAQYFTRRVAEALLQRGLSVQNPVVSLPGNEIEQVLLGLAAAYAGIPYVPLATAALGNLEEIFKLITPGMVFATSGMRLEPLREAMPASAELVVNEAPLEDTTMFADLVNTEPTEGLDHAHSHVGPETVLKIFFGGSPPGTVPKGTIVTNRMWASNQEMARSFYRFLTDEPPLLVDGAENAGMILYNGGSLYLDQADVSYRNLRVIAPTLFRITPNDVENLISVLHRDPSFRKHFFSRLKVLFYSGAELPLEMKDDFAEILVVTSTGSSEFPPHSLFNGTPAQGVEVKLVPIGLEEFDVRSKGPNVTWGFWRSLDQTKAAFDEEGFFKTGEILSADNLRS